MRYLKISSVIFGVAIFFFFSGCSSIFSGDATKVHKPPESEKLSVDSDIPQAKAHPYAYSGTLKRYDASFWVLPFFRPDYDYYIVDEKGNTSAFLDISDFATGTSLTNFMDKTVTVSGQTAPHKYRGVIVVKVKHIIVVTNQKI